MRSIKNEKNLTNKFILLRLDLNVPLDQGKISDTTRIDKIIPTLKYLVSQKTKIIILSHIGRPKGKIINELSLKPIREDLQKKLNINVKLIKKNRAKLVGFASLIDRSTKKSLTIKKKIISHLKIDVPTFKQNELPDYLKKVPITTPGSRFIK